LFYCSIGYTQDPSLGGNNCGNYAPYNLPDYCHYTTTAFGVSDPNSLGSIVCNPPPPPVVTTTVSPAAVVPRLSGTDWYQYPDNSFCKIISNTKVCIKPDQIDSTECQGAHISYGRCIIHVDLSDPNNPKKWKWVDSPYHLVPHLGLSQIPAIGFPNNKSPNNPSQPPGISPPKSGD
jgi:hypothetical protein